MKVNYNVHYSTDELKKLQSIEKFMLKDFIAACKQLNIQYVLYGGTLLGAVKYNGFVPWDDDVDVALLREDYEVFIKEADNLLKDKYIIQTPHNCPLSPFPYTKIRKKGTCFVDYSSRNVPIDNGIYIDVYPIDKIPDNEILRRKQFNRARRNILLYVYRQMPLYDNEPKTVKGIVRRIAKWSIYKALRMLPQKLYADNIDRAMTIYNGSNTDRYAALNSPNYQNIYLHLFPLETGTFEGMEVCLPGDYHTHLTMRYGDYSGLPPEDKRYGHIPYKLDFGTDA